MRLTNRCFLSLALCFTLSMLLNAKAAHCGDAILPPGCCKFFCDADFAPLDRAFETRTFEIGTFGSAAPGRRTATTTKTATPIQTLLVGPSLRVWNFTYKAPSTSTPKVARKASMASPAIAAPVAYNYCNPHQAEPDTVLSLKRRVAPMLFWDAGSWSDMTILIRLFAGEAATTIRTCTAPIEHLPSRVIRLAGDVIWLK